MRTFEFYSTNYSTIIQADTLHLAIKEFMRRYPNDEILQIEDVDSRESQSAVPSEKEIEKLGDEHVAGFADEYKALAKINFINGFKRKRGIAG